MASAFDSHREDARIKVGSERSFGIVFAVVFLLVGLWPLTGDGGPRLWALGTAVAFLGIGLFAPRLLRPLNGLWFRFGQVLHRIASPLVMGIIFFGVVTPTALIMRLLGKDVLGRKKNARAASYWIAREPKTISMDDLKNQF